MLKNRVLAALLVLMLLLCSAVLAEEKPEAPKVQFYIEQYIGHLGRETSVIVKTTTPKRITKDNNTFELRNHRGEVLHTAQWKSPTSRLTFRFTVEEFALGGNELSVWWNDQCVTAETAYAAYSNLEVKRVTELAPETPAVTLTIVCGGGSAKDVADILAVLEKHQVKCTFFLGGGWLEGHVEEAKQILQAGHEIASHGYQHVHMPDMSSYRGMRNVITKMNERCEELLGVRPVLFRAPYSDTNQKVTALVRAEGMEEIQWNIDSRDWSDTYKNKPQNIVKRVTGDKVDSGAVIQFHLNGYGTPQVLDEIIPYYQNERGFQVVTVSELLALSGREIPPMPDIDQAEQVAP